MWCDIVARWALRHSGVEVAVLILEWWDIVVVVVLGGWGSAGKITLVLRVSLSILGRCLHFECWVLYCLCTWPGNLGLNGIVVRRM